MLAKFQVVIIEGHAMGSSLGRLLPTSEPGNLGFQKCSGVLAVIIGTTPVFSQALFSSLLRAVMLYAF